MLLNLQGLAELAHQVITEFISWSPQFDKEDHSYYLERFQVVRLPTSGG